jgi:membrane protein DedA with SNARE-associated domain
MKTRRFGTGVLVTVLFGFLAWALVVGYLGWTSSPGVEMPSIGFGALIFGVVMSLIVGIGLMALVFFSSRSGYDEPPKYDLSPEDTEPTDERSEDSKPD